jgi:hypothetical protein
MYHIEIYLYIPLINILIKIYNIRTIDLPLIGDLNRPNI